MIKLAKIDFHRVEGRTDECKPLTFTSWEALRAHVKVAALTAPDDGSYDKCDVIAVWEDSSTWYYRADLTRKHRFAGEVATELHLDVAFWAGLKRPGHMDETTYKTFLANTGANVKAMAAKIATGHDFGVEEMAA